MMIVDTGASVVQKGKSRVTTRLGAVDCRSCGARCCHYVTCRLDEPQCSEEHDNVRWYLLHHDVSVFVDLAGEWFVQFDTACEDVSEEGLCQRYSTRPSLCKEHGEDDTICEYHAETDPYRHFFRSVREFEDYLGMQS